ncbi:MAG: hypothetical protein COU81_03270 [Candidatus Portnoybacteria bacterium CG10_big_fil_rev_8_21_14_0_10_36_7]|uniref:PLD phosphodiesterase domain-containing protein n=1 Tax=Candidatus Portnoybacteria bacterium CG10_big_fil_rev_8_21_14_0_10_36_7 TaxID=1974812 RepID=A0A2M8KDH5_9BACT|nr:MAG: hypothetical protein COU81_03270 [Candidatus Portnoybacteria bacterium CG10_big_fil_rev_8_21_14_0_10_36_7]
MFRDIESQYSYGLELREPADNFAVLTAFEFLNDYKLEAQKAKQRVWGQAMSMQAGHPGQLFFQIFKTAAKRKLDARLNIDWFSRLTSEAGINSTIPVKSIIGKGDYHKFFKNRNEEAFRDLINSGVNVNFLNPPDKIQKIFPFLGRNHIKIYIVDNVAWLGGVNICDASFNAIDFVVKITNPRIVDVLTEEFEFSNQEKTDDQVVTENGTLFIDSGEAGQSIILDEAQFMVNTAQKKVRNISFFTPDGPFLKSLKDAHDRGVDVEVLKPSETSGIYVLLDLVNKVNMNIKRRKVPFTEVHDSVHAKLLIIDDESVLFGSHNLMKSGVNAGTQEIAFYSTNPILVRNLINFYNKARNGEFKQN